MRIFYSLILVLLPSLLSAQIRIKQSINTNWQFHKGALDEAQLRSPEIQWETITLPHSYNTHDVSDDAPDYYRGDTWYKKVIYVPASWKEKQAYIFFEGVNQVANIYINGKPAGEHVGGYTAFRFRINDLIQFDAANEIAVKVNNAFNPDIAPLTADFTFFGGIYRDVYLEVLNPIHFDTDNFASSGVFVSTPQVSAENASVTVRGEIVNSSGAEKNILAITKLFDQKSVMLAKQETKIKLKQNQKVPFVHNKISIAKPELWTPEHPTLYRIVTVLVDVKTGQSLDEFSSPVGFRWYSFTGDKGFFLNGKPYKIWGTSRHQDFPYKANALPDALHVQDVQLLKAMGGNFLRVAHYPQDPTILEACDRLGILASVEIPVVNTVTESAAFTENSKRMQVEMIRQNYNHPSVIMWAYMNEVLLRVPFRDDKPRQEFYFKNVVRLATTLDSLTRQEDPSRITMMAFHGNYSLYKRLGMIGIPMVAGWNLYQGWYSENIQGFGEFLDKHFADFPEQPTLITEYGADGDPRVRGFSPVRFDKTVEYETYYHKVYIKAIEARSFVSGGLVWNLADFNSETRAESMPHVNNKGLLDSYRHPKDAYLLYQSHLLKIPFLRIGSRSWNIRGGVAVSEDSLHARQSIEIYTNINGTIALRNNGKLIGEKRASDGIVQFEVNFSDGLNQLEATGADMRDVIDIYFQLQPSQLNSEKLRFKEINISLGDNRYYIDEQQNVWLPEKPYEKGSWGYVGGEVFVPASKGRQQYGSDKNILGTDDDPMYETQRTGIQQFKLDVPDGKYAITFHFAELLGGEKREALVYNLGNGDPALNNSANRKFDVKINGQKVIDGLSNANYLIPETAYASKMIIDVSEGKGIVIDFIAIEGTSILNGLQVRRVY
jgi:beta-galactosidase